MLDSALAQWVTHLPPWLQTTIAWGRWFHAWALAHPTLMIGVGIGVVGVATVIGWLRGKPTEETSEEYGTARLATPQELLTSPKFNGTGIPAGYVRGRQLRLDHEEDVLVVGPKGVGKSRRVMIKAISDCVHSTIVIDTNGELLKHTIAARRQRGPVYIFDPLNPSGDHYNIFQGIRWPADLDTVGWDEVADTQRVIDNLMYQDPHVHQTDAGTFYRPWANVMHVGSVIFLAHRRPSLLSPAGLLSFYQSGEGNFLGVLKHMADDPHAKVRAIATSVLSNKPDIIKNIWSSAMISLLPWMDDKLAAVTSDTTIPIECLQQEPYPSTVYLRITPRDMKGRLQGVARAILDQWSARLTDRDPDTYEQEVTWVVDDMAMLGYMEFLRDTPAHNRKYGHRTLYACQSFGQLSDNFGQHYGSILTNSTTWMMFRPQERREADIIAGRLGEMTVTELVERTTTRGWSTRSQSTGPQSHKRELMTPDEILRLGNGEEGWMLVCVAGERPALVKNLSIDEEA
jgi:type IV secretion system protein VirD4